jgi:hypothetical protein
LLNRDLQPVIENAQIHWPNDATSSLWISGIPYGIDIFRQFVTPGCAIFHRCHRSLPIQLHYCGQPIADIFSDSDILKQYLRERLHSLKTLLWHQSASHIKG